MGGILKRRSWVLLIAVFPIAGCYLDVSEEEPQPVETIDQSDRELGISEVSPDQVLPNVPKARKDDYHEVQKGESLSDIAKRYRTTAEELAKVNVLGEPDRLTPGQLIYIPAGIDENPNLNQENSP